MFDDLAKGFPAGIVALAKTHPCFPGKFEQFLYELARDHCSERQVSECPFPVWRTIEIGTHHSAKKLCQAVSDSGCKIGYYQKPWLTKISVASRPTRVDLVRLKFYDLGVGPYDGYWDYTDRVAWDRLSALGLEGCTPEMGLQLRRQYLNQPPGEHLRIIFSMAESQDGREALSVCCRRGGSMAGKYVGGTYAHLHNPHYASKQPLIFVRK